ncbi:MAG: SEL1-like repeat protein [Oscillospiraceae bacterium]|nr:SEL1-like repeat protein [Oscillospiraceae bacterium]
MTAAEIYNMGYEYYEQQKYSTAFELFQKSSAMGLSAADNMLGIMYRKGLSVPTDYGKARECYEKARRAGNPYGALNIGVMYECGYGVPKDLNRAIEYYKEASRGGCKEGDTNLQRLAAQTRPQAQAQPNTGVRYCGHCGSALQPTAKFCIQCGSPVQPATPAQQYQAAPAQQYKAAPVQQRQVQHQAASRPAASGDGKILMPLLGALGGMMISVAAIILIGQLGYVAALGGVLLGVLPIAGYLKMGGKISGFSLLLSIAIVLAGPYLAVVLSAAIEELIYYGTWYFSWDISGASEETLGLLYGFTLLGAFRPILNIIKELKNSKK